MSSRNLRTKAVANVLMLAAGLMVAACAGSDTDAIDVDVATAGEYIVERSDADGVETVRTVSGSRWGADARLVEELAIGEETGDEAYLFGSVNAAWAASDRYYVVDLQAPAVRAYDLEGKHLFDVGRTGQGPGEYSRPMALAVAGDGRVYVTDLMGARLNVYDDAGESIDDWSLGSPQAALGLLLTFDGEVFTRTIEIPEEMPTSGALGELREGMQAVGPDGLVGEPLYPPTIPYERPTIDVEVGGNSMSLAIAPYTPGYEWTLAPGGQFVAGVGNEYRFEIIAPDGKRTVVEKTWDPVEVLPDEVAFRADRAAAPMRRMAPDFAISGSDVPDIKPAFDRFFADRSGRVWVVRQEVSRPDPECAASGSGGIGLMIGAGGGADVVRMDGASSADDSFEGNCWADTYSFDVFELATGEFLGTVRPPEAAFQTPLFVEGDTVLASITDDLGTIRVKKYRLVIGS